MRLLFFHSIIWQILLIVFLFQIAGCGLEPPIKAVAPTPSSQSARQQITEKAIEEADVSVLFIGNSHAAPLPRWLEEVFSIEQPDKKTLFVAAPGFGFLSDHATRKSTIGLIKKGQWDFVVLQAQKYSTSGKYKYPYDGAIKLAEIANEKGSKVLMFPEWSRRGIPQEYLRISKIHHEIASQTNATVVPVGEAWVKVAKANPQVELYAADGNHASELGSYLNACLFYGMITEKQVVTGCLSRNATGFRKDMAEQIALIHKSAGSAVQEKSSDPSIGKGATVPSQPGND